MIAIQYKYGIFIDMALLQIVEKFLQCLIRIVCCGKVAIDCLILCIALWNAVFLVIWKREMIGKGDKFTVKRLLQLLQILCGLLKEQLILQPVFCGIFLCQDKITGIKEVVIAKAPVHIVPVPEGTVIAMKHCAGITFLILQDLWQGIIRIVSVLYECRTFGYTKQGRFRHQLRITAFALANLSKEIGKREGVLAVTQLIQKGKNLVFLSVFTRKPEVD